MSTEIIFFEVNIASSVENAARYITLQTDSRRSLQTQFVGPSRDELVDPYFYPTERFTSLLALDLLEGAVAPELYYTWMQFTKIQEGANGSRINFFCENSYGLPDDNETTSLYYLTVGKKNSQEKLQEVAKDILANTCPDTGEQQLYFPPRDTRHGIIDPVCSSNCMRFLYTVGTGDAAKPTEDALMRFLTTNEYLNGTRYYKSPDSFLYYLSRAVSVSEKAQARFKGPLAKAVASRLGGTTYPLDSALRILALNNLGLLTKSNLYNEAKLNDELRNIVSKQMSDGGWEKDCLYKSGKSPIYHGGRELTTLYCLAAMYVCKSLNTNSEILVSEDKHDCLFGGILNI